MPLLFCAPRENQSGSEYRDLDGSQSLAINRQRHQSKLTQLCKTLFYAARYQSKLEDGEEGGTEKRRNLIDKVESDSSSSQGIRQHEDQH